MIKIDYAVVVEGKYDKIKLSNIIDAVIITTDGFGIYKNREKRELIKLLASKKGLLVITDSDYAGMQIRSYLKNICRDKDIVNVYIPEIKGKEKRKTKPSSSGNLGVEGMSEEIILKALQRSKISSSVTEQTQKITKQDLFKFSLSGTFGAKENRKEISKRLLIPENLSSNAFLDAVNALFTYEEFINEVELWRQDADKN